MLRIKKVGNEMEKTVIVELICKKSFNDGTMSLFEGLVYKGSKKTDEYGDYYVIYNHSRDDFQIFKPTYEKIEADIVDYPCILEYFYTKAEWREKQIDSILE